MREKKNVTMYYCDFCKKKGMRKDVIATHEKWCFHNPENKRACNDCVHLEPAEINGYYFEPYHGTEHEVKLKGFRCAKLDKNVYPLEVERRGLLDRYSETFEDQIPMPKQCEHQKTHYDNLF